MTARYQARVRVGQHVAWSAEVPAYRVLDTQDYRLIGNLVSKATAEQTARRLNERAAR